MCSALLACSLSARTALTRSHASIVLCADDRACQQLAESGALPPTDGRLISWCGTSHHHPSRLRLIELAAEHPTRLACNNVVDRAKEGVDGQEGGTPGANAARPQHRSLLEQVARCAYLLDIQGKGYSSRLKLLLHR